MELQVNGHREVPGPHFPACSPGTGWQMGMLASSASSPAGQSTQWLAPRPLGWAVGPPPTGMQLAARSRWAGWPGRWLTVMLPAGFATPGALAPLGWHRWAAGPTCWLPMDGQLAQAAQRRAPRPPPGRPLKCLRASANGNQSQNPPPRHSDEFAGKASFLAHTSCDPS